MMRLIYIKKSNRDNSFKQISFKENKEITFHVRMRFCTGRECGVVITVQFLSLKLELTFCTGLNTPGAVGDLTW